MATRRKTKKSIPKGYEVFAVDMGGSHTKRRLGSSSDVSRVFSRLLNDNSMTRIAIKSLTTGRTKVFSREWTTGRWSKPEIKK